MNKIPVIMLSGFLGSGKTTFLLKLLKEAENHGVTCSVLINEFGSIDIDGAVISHSLNNTEIESIANGCVCCSKKSELTTCFERLLRQKPDLILVELTGVANPEEVLNSLNEKELIAKVSLKKIISIIDAEQSIKSNNADESANELEQIYRRQIELADLLILNKVDLVTEIERKQLEIDLSSKNKSSTILSTIQAKIDFAWLFKDILSNRNGNRFQQTKELSKYRKNINAQSNNLSYSHLTTIVLPILQPLDRDTVEEFINKWGVQIVRAKGFIPIKNEDVTELMQYVNNRITWERIVDIEHHNLVIIGIDIDDRKIKKEWTSLNVSEVSL